MRSASLSSRGAWTATLVLTASLAASVPASAQTVLWEDGDQKWIQEGHCVVVQRECPDPARAERRVPAPSPHHLLYLNPCRGGETFTAGYEDESRANRSSIIRSGERAMSEFPWSEASWQTVVSRVRGFYAPFSIQVTDVDPGAAPHAEVAVCGSGEEWGIVNSGNTVVLGISPMQCDVIPNSISFVFPLDHGDDPGMIAESAAHEAGHALSLNHELLCEDLMSYECVGVEKEGFVDQDSPCVEYDEELTPTEVDCICEPADHQNTHQSLLAAFGPGSPRRPRVFITEPGYNQVVEPGFVVRFDIDDPYDSTERAELWIDGALDFELDTAPFVFNGPDQLSDGGHQVEVRIFTDYGEAADSVMVVVGPPCGAEDCAEGEACVEGRCVTGPGVAGGLGETCVEGDDCASGLCANDGLVKRCIEICDPSATGCPAGFDCVRAGEDDGVCWPAEEEPPAGGCAVARDDDPPWLLLVLSLVAGLALLGGRRMRRA